MEVPPVHQRHLGIGRAEPAHDLQAGEAPADDDHPMRLPSPALSRAQGPAPPGLHRVLSRPGPLALILSQRRATPAGQFRLPVPASLRRPGC